MAPKRSRGGVDDIDYVEHRFHEQTSLWVLWNVVIWPETLERALRSPGGGRVKDVLQLKDDLPHEILQAEYVDVRFIGVPLEPGISPENRVYECFGISLVMIKHTEAFADYFFVSHPNLMTKKDVAKR